MQLGYPDQVNFSKNIALVIGNPNIRYVSVPRAGTGAERVATFYDNMIKALTSPLTAKEKESGIYSPPAPPRILFTGTLDEAQDFMQQTVLIENCRQCPIAKYTDGLPIIVPTEQKVAEMLTGTSHPGTEVLKIPYPTAVVSTATAAAPAAAPSTTGIQAAPGGAGSGVRAGFTDIVTFTHKTYQATVEKVAVCAVMAGCKPEHMPAALAIASQGGNHTDCPGTSSFVSSIWVVSGPFAKEVGMNAGHEALDIGNPSNMALGRVGALISINLGGCITGLVRSDTGNPIHDICFAEDVEALPPGWLGLNEEQTHVNADATARVNYTKTESTIGRIGGQQVMVGFGHAPGSHRQVPSGYGGLARYIQNLHGWPEGYPGPYNFLEAYIPGIMAQNGGASTSVCLVCHQTMAGQLYNYGFKTKAAVIAWMSDVKNYWVTAASYYRSGWWDYQTDEGRSIERTTGKTYMDLAKNQPDFRMAAIGSGSGIIVADSFADEHCWVFGGGQPGGTPIDPWR